MFVRTRKPTVVAVGLWVFGFSFTRVFEFLFEYLSKDYEIYWLGIGYKGEVVKHTNYTLYPVNIKGGDLYGSKAAAELAVSVKADSILLINDFFMLKNYEYHWLPLKKNGIKLVAYVPMDGSFINIEEVKAAFYLDTLVLYHKGAVHDVEKTINSYEIKHSSEKNTVPKLEVCYHGVDLSLFSPPTSIDERKKLKKQLFPVDGAENSLFILNANRYNERKNLVATIDAFAKALPDCNRPVYLVLHTPNMNDIKTKELSSCIHQSGAEAHILLNPLGEQYCDDVLLNQLYQACEIGINTSYGEGWGLISFEHAAAGAAQIVPDHTCPGEIWKGVALLTPVKNTLKLPTNPFLMFDIDVPILSRQMVALVNDAVLLEKTAEKCRMYANDIPFSWQAIAQKWKGILG